MFERMLHRLVNTIWYGNNPLTYIFLPLSWLFGFFSAYRKRSQLKNEINFSIPVVIVGNITVGGTGKTPMVIALTNELKNLDYRVGVASRGYHGHARQNTLVSQQHTAYDIGDEPLLIYQNTQASVMVGKDRLSVISSLIDDCQCDIVICDDGLQDYRFHHDLEIIMVDGDRVFGNQRLLPAGPLREEVQRLQQADFVVSSAKVTPAISSDYMKFNIEHAFRLNNREITTQLNEWCGKTVHALAGIANPKRFFAALKSKGLILIEHEFPDHANLNRTDLVFSDQIPIFMTEKDAVKCGQFDIDNIWVVPLQIELPNNFLPRVLAGINQK